MAEGLVELADGFAHRIQHLVTGNTLLEWAAAAEWKISPSPLTCGWEEAGVAVVVGYSLHTHKTQMQYQPPTQ